MNTDTCTVYSDALCIVTLSVCCVTGTDNDTVTDIDVDIDTDTDTYTDTVHNDTAAARKLYFEITYYTMSYHALMMYAHFSLHQNEPCVMSD